MNDDEWSSYARIETLTFFLFTKDRFNFNLSHEILNMLFIRNEIINSKSWNIKNLWDVDFDK